MTTAVHTYSVNENCCPRLLNNWTMWEADDKWGFFHEVHVLWGLANYTDWCLLAIKVVSKKLPQEKSNHKVVVEMRMSRSNESNSISYCGQSKF